MFHDGWSWKTGFASGICSNWRILEMFSRFSSPRNGFSVSINQMFPRTGFPHETHPQNSAQLHGPGALIIKHHTETHWDTRCSIAIFRFWGICRIPQNGDVFFSDEIQGKLMFKSDHPPEMFTWPTLRYLYVLEPDSSAPATVQSSELTAMTAMTDTTWVQLKQLQFLYVSMTEIPAVFFGMSRAKL